MAGDLPFLLQDKHLALGESLRVLVSGRKADNSGPNDGNFGSFHGYLTLEGLVIMSDRAEIRDALAAARGAGGLTERNPLGPACWHQRASIRFTEDIRIRAAAARIGVAQRR
jgi:hypothetical protein